MALAFTRLFLALTLVLTACGATPAPLAPKAIELNREGADALAKGELELAHARIALALEYHPRFTEAWVNLGLLELERGRYDLADDALAEARRLNRNLPSPHHGLGLLAERRNDSYAAKIHYRAALEVDPGFAPARINLGRLLYAERRFDEAREQFLRLTEVAPEVVLGWRGLVQSLVRMGRITDADAALDRVPQALLAAPEIELLVARHAARNGDLEAAIQRLRRVERANETPNDLRAEALGWLAILAIGVGDAKSARRDLDAARALDPASELVSAAEATWGQSR